MNETRHPCPHALCARPVGGRHVDACPRSRVSTQDRLRRTPAPGLGTTTDKSLLGRFWSALRGSR